MEETRATKLFSDYVSAHDKGLDPNLDALCREHPKCADELRELHSIWQQARSELGANDDATRAMTRPAEGGGLRLSPPESEEAEPVPASLLARLTKRGPPKQRFVVKERIGQGGMGAVYRVYDNELGRHVAAKVIRSDDPAYLPRFLEEAQITGQLDHPAFIPVHDIGVDEDGKVFFTMKLVKGIAEEGKADVRGETLVDVIERIHASEKGEWTLTRGISDVIVRVAEAMAFAHAKGVIHRDLKPANILVGRYGEVYVTDFGIARVQGKERAAVQASSIPLTLVRTERRDSIERNAATPPLSDSPISPGPTEEGATIGTAEYMPPEQAEGRLAEIGQRSDIYSLGATLYHLIAGVPPWHTREEHPARNAILRRIAAGAKPAALHTLASHVPAELVAIVDRAMAEKPSRRYASMQEFAADLRAYLERRVVSAYETGAFAELKKWIQRNPALSAAAGLLVLVLGGATAIVTKKNREVEAKNLALNKAKDEITEQKGALEIQNQEIESQKRLVETQKQLAEAKIREFDQLSGKVYLERALDREMELYPPWPEKIEAMERWLAEDAKRLLDLKPALESTLADLRARALPQSDEEKESDRLNHPKFAELEKLRPKRAWLRRMIEARDAATPAKLPDLPRELANQPATKLDDYAWERVNPDFSKRRFEDESLALSAALLAARKVADGDTSMGRAYILDTLAWAYFANGRFEEARTESAHALKAASNEERLEYLRLSASLVKWIQNYSGKSGNRKLAALETQVDELETEVAKRRTWSFATEAEEFLHSTLFKLAADINSFLSEAQSNVEQRLSWAKRIDDLTLHHPKARVSWAEARAAIRKADDIVASKLYAQSPGAPIDLKPQTGLVPIGMNPVTKLWEFYELRSACDVAVGEDPASIEIPVHREDGSIEVKDGTGIVFVLLPGGTFLQGAQKDDPNAPNYDPDARSDERPQQVTLAPFFLARHELTTGQCRRLVGDEPSYFTRGSRYDEDPIAMGWTHPVNQIDWGTTDRWLRRHGLILPTEAQWEYGARGGTTTPWWTGIEASSSAGASNVLDLRAEAKYPGWGRQMGDFDDGFISLAPVGRFRENPFGLFDVQGNVCEWCLDAYANRYGVARDGDGLRAVDAASPSLRVYRGGGYNVPASYARSAIRIRNAPTIRDPNLGARPSRILDPSP